MFQDKNGDMWFATDRGIAKYDGFNFKIFDVSSGLPSNTIFDFFPQEDGKVWCSTINSSWFYFQDGTEYFQKHKFSDTLQKYSYNNECHDLLIKDNGNICVSFENHFGYIEIDKYGKLVHKLGRIYESNLDQKCVQMRDGNDFFHYYVRVLNNQTSSQNSIASPFEKSGYKKSAHINGYFAFSTDKTLYLKKEDQAPKEFNLTYGIIGLGQYDSKHIWVGFRGDGIRIYDMNMVEKAHYLTDNYVTDLYRDHHGGIWISTLYNGIYYAMNDKIEKVKTEEDLFVYQIAQGDKNQVALVSNNALMYLLKDNILSEPIDLKSAYLELYYNLKTKSFENIFSGKNIIDSLFKSESYAIIDVSENPRRPVLVSLTKSILVGNKKGDFARFPTALRLTCAEYAQNGFIYGTYSGIYYLDTLNNKEFKLSQPEFQFRITDIKLVDGYHFIGTSGNGVLRFNETTGKIDKVTTKHGLTSNIINEIFAESKSCVWVATSTGLNKIVFNNGSCKVFTLTQENGLPNDEITDVIKKGDILWVGTSSGLLKLRDSDFTFLRKNLNLHLFWKDFKNNNKAITKAELQDLTYDSRNIKFAFHLSYFGGAKNVKIRYKLVGQDTKWTYTDQHFVNFNYLEPSDYTLLVQVRAENGDWSFNQIRLDFSIKPPFYATWWFIVLSILTIGLLIYWFFKVRILIYNKDLVRELLRLIVRKIRPQTNSFVIWSQGNEIRISSNDVLYFKSEGNYLEIITAQKKYTFRYKIGELNSLVPDRLEYLQVHRSYVVRVDKISGKSLETLDIQGHVVPIGKTYKDMIRKLEF